ncbi:hypothetical protein DEO72_LG9g3750 [Vigna unguiculata]|uniref:Uncharacterized protein n=1 Tax=Vigna unguiculata TaxID=3917 RepID=A0A4D6N780_VIGUN|nr:hypothetical protein DEO72_LG9g3750 [Vigna unguiculata]
MELKGWSEKKKKNRALMVGGKGNEVVSYREEGGRVVRMKIVVRKSELKQVLEMMSAVKPTMMLESSVSCVEEQRLKVLWKTKYVSTTNRNRHTCWTPVLQSIPEERLV